MNTTLHKWSVEVHSALWCLLPSLKGHQSEDASWPENVETVLIFPCAGYIWLLWYSHKTSTFLFQIGAPQGAAMLAHSLPMKGRTRLACTCPILLPHIQAFFRMSLIQTARRKMEAFTAMFCATFKGKFLTSRSRIKWRTFVCWFFYSIGIDRTHDASSLQFLFKLLLDTRNTTPCDWPVPAQSTLLVSVHLQIYNIYICTSVFIIFIIIIMHCCF